MTENGSFSVLLPRRISMLEFVKVPDFNYKALDFGAPPPQC
jgi:hypothetical protein